MLHAGPLDSVHLRRWVDLGIELGHEVVVAGHLRPGFRAAVTPPVVCHRAPQLPWASTRHARGSGRAVDRALAALPNPAVEVPLAAAWLRRLVRRVQPDVIHAHWLPHWGAAAALAGGRVAGGPPAGGPPLVAGALGSDVYLARGVRKRLAGLALARADAVLAPSPHAAAALAARLAATTRSAPTRPAGRVLHLEQGVDLEEFGPPSPARREAARARLGLGSGPAVLSFRGAAPVYDLPLAVESFRRLLARRPDAQLLVAHGPAPLDRRTAAALGALGSSARVLGAVAPEEMSTCFHAADAGVSVPTSDGSPSSVWESLACGTPVVCSALPQLSHRAGAEAGAIPVAHDPDAVASALEALIADPDRARALGAAGRRWCEANVDRRDTLLRVDALYRELVRGTASGGAGFPPAARA